MCCKRFCNFFYRKTSTLADVLLLTLVDTKASTTLKTTYPLFRACPGFQNSLPLHNGGPLWVAPNLI